MQRVLDGIPDTILKPQPITPPERLDQVDENQPLNVAGILQHVGPAPSPVKPPALPRRTICLQWGAWTALQHRLTTHIYIFFFLNPYIPLTHSSTITRLQVTRPYPSTWLAACLERLSKLDNPCWSCRCRSDRGWASFPSSLPALRGVCRLPAG